ncbi:MAG TPA: Holliday junction branch migration protein RuvA [Candidatus Glassbacteria bacterium]|nr:Holliday junction branch migration protein RuvA [Candidatus Glassbacteria bacterium]
MIALLEGKLVEKSPSAVVISAAGVGYLVHVPLSTFDTLPAANDSVRLFTYLHVREDTLQLYGFATRQERGTFEKMISVTGVGPRLALAILSSLSVERLVVAIETGQAALLDRIPGGGKKTADRLVLELKGKLGAVAPVETGAAGALVAGGQAEEAVAALLSLGFARAQAEKAIIKALEGAAKGSDTSELVRRALSSM